MKKKLSTKDKKFCDVVYLYEKHYKDMYANSLEYKINLTPKNIENIMSEVEVVKNNKATKVPFILVGIEKDNKFTWAGNSGKFYYNHINNNYGWIIDDYVSKNFLDDMFDKEGFIIDKKYPNLFLYILSIIMPAYNVIRFENESSDVFIYGLIKLGLKDNYDYEKEFIKKLNK